MNYTFTNKGSDEIIRDLEANRPQAEIGAGAYEIAGAALQAAVARESRRWVIASTALSVASLAVASTALLH